MTSAQQDLVVGRIAAGTPPWRPPGHRPLHGSDFTWAVAFVVPYAAVFFIFAVYPMGYALWMAGNPALYAELIDDPIYRSTVVNTLLFVGLGVNLKMFLAVLLSGFFMQRRWWTKALLVIYILPWLLPAVQTGIAFHWMLIGEPGLIDRVLFELFGIDGSPFHRYRSDCGWRSRFDARPDLPDDLEEPSVTFAHGESKKSARARSFVPHGR